jgi:hypothetical protein
MTLFIYLIVGLIISTAIIGRITYLDTTEGYPIRNDCEYFVGGLFMAFTLVWPAVLALSLLMNIAWCIGKVFQKLGGKI